MPAKQLVQQIKRSDLEEGDTLKSTSRPNNYSSRANEISLQDIEARLLRYRKNASTKAFKEHYCRSDGAIETPNKYKISR